MVTKNDLKIDYCFSFHTISVTIPATNTVITQYNIPLHKGIHLCLINDMILLKKMQMEYSKSAVSMATISNMATIQKQQYLGHIFSNI